MVKYKKIAGLGLIGFAAVGTFVLTLQHEPVRTESSPEKSNFGDALDSTERALLQPGDIVLRKGFGWLSESISRYCPDAVEVSHCGILVLHRGEPHVIHSVSSSASDWDGVQMHALSDFCAQSQRNSLVVVRFNAPDAGQRLSAYAHQKLQQRIPFDHAFDPTDTTALYCSELVWSAIHSASQVDILNSSGYDRPHLRFDVFLNPEHFRVILNHHSRRTVPDQAKKGPQALS